VGGQQRFEDVSCRLPRHIRRAGLAGRRWRCRKGDRERDHVAEVLRLGRERMLRRVHSTPPSNPWAKFALPSQWTENKPKTAPR
jgi:hypothetical protein